MTGAFSICKNSFAEVSVIACAGARISPATRDLRVFMLSLEMNKNTITRVGPIEGLFTALTFGIFLAVVFARMQSCREPHSR